MEQELREYLIRKYVTDSKFTLLGEDKLLRIYRAIKDIKAKNILGVSAEMGCYRGGCSYYIAKLLDRPHYAFDTFEGLQNVKEIDGDKMYDGMFNDITEEQVQVLLRGTKAKTVKGLFTGDREDELFCLSHFDGDTYESCKAHLNYFFKNTVQGGYLFFDDYGFRNATGVAKAVDEFLDGRSDFKGAFVSTRHQFCIMK